MERVDRIAEAQRRSRSNMIRILVERALDQIDLPEPVGGPDAP